MFSKCDKFTLDGQLKWVKSNGETLGLKEL